MPKRKTSKSRPLNGKKLHSNRRSPVRAAAGSKAGAPAAAVASEGEEASDMSSLAKIFAEAAKVEESRPGLKWLDVECPYCGEDFEITVDPAEEGHEMIQDCRACCKAITFSVDMEDGEVSVSAFRD